jgi:hypothetical protein
MQRIFVGVVGCLWLVGVARAQTPVAARADGLATGVGVGLGSVRVGEILKPGGIYELPDLPVINTGEVAGTYEVRATLVNPKGWTEKPLGLGSDAFRFSPQSFHLVPDQSRLVSVTLTLPLNTLDGDYLFYLEASPVQNPTKGVALGPTAATKLYFSVQAGTVLGALRTRLITFILTRPEIYLLLAVLLLLEAFFLLRRHFSLHLELQPKPPTTSKSNKR